MEHAGVSKPVQFAVKQLPQFIEVEPATLPLNFLILQPLVESGVLPSTAGEVAAALSSGAAMFPSIILFRQQAA